MPISTNLLSPFAAVFAHQEALVRAERNARDGKNTKLKNPKKDSKKKAPTKGKKPSKKRGSKKGGESFPRGESVFLDPGRFLTQMVSVHGSVQLAEEVGGTPKGRLRLDEAGKNTAYAVAREVGTRLDGLQKHLDDVFMGRIEVITPVRLSRVLRTATSSPGDRAARVQAAVPFQGFMRMHMANVRQNMASLQEEMTPRILALNDVAVDVVRLEAAIADAVGLKLDALLLALQERLEKSFLEALKEPVAEVFSVAAAENERPDATPLFAKDGVLEKHQKLMGETIRALFLVEEKRLRAYFQAFISAPGQPISEVDGAELASDAHIEDLESSTTPSKKWTTTTLEKEDGEVI
ncbi:MAG: hypothetical protein GY822_10955 [Deltaproteobacteria bacterium]|nr:hypothetical protein [Deltaproteobacteria bacterium]